MTGVRSVAGHEVWAVAQWAGVLALLVLLTGLFARPEATLPIFWNVVVPLLPASFLISPAVWRNLCPLATLNMLPAAAQRRQLTQRPAAVAALVGVALLIVLVPARHLAFNDNGPVLAGTILLVGGLALLAGFVYDAKAGFCNAICPVLPVERLYGRHPLMEIDNARCQPCTVCTRKGCPDLTTRSLEKLSDTEKHGMAWLRTVNGAFVAAFPGFVVGYYLAADGDALLPVYAAAWGGGALSYGAVTVMATVSRMSPSIMFTTLAALAIGLYYWFVAPIVAETINVGEFVTWITRGAAALLILAWLVRARTAMRAPRTAEHPALGGS